MHRIGALPAPPRGPGRPPDSALARTVPARHLSAPRPSPTPVSNVLEEDPLSLPLIIMAAGLSTRFGRLKQLHPLGPKGEAILDYNVYDALRAGFDQVLFVVRPEILSDMRAHVRRIIGDAVPVTFVCQELGGLPSGFRAPPDRKKPWGTGQAVLTAAEHIDCPFAVCNADDLYGPGAFELVASHLRTRPSPTDSVLRKN